jgi:hypothetical protein
MCRDAHVATITTLRCCFDRQITTFPEFPDRQIARSSNRQISRDLLHSYATARKLCENKANLSKFFDIHDI